MTSNVNPFSCIRFLVSAMSAMEDCTKIKPTKNVKPKQQAKNKPEKAVETKPKQIESKTNARLKRIVQMKLS